MIPGREHSFLPSVPLFFLYVVRCKSAPDPPIRRKTFPKYVPKEKVADFLESYAIGQELNVWLSTTVLPTPTYDEECGRWRVTVDRKGEKIELTPRHVIMAAGMGKAYMPDFSGVSEFKGVLYHSDEHHGAAPFKGKRVIVVGAVSMFALNASCDEG